MKKSTLIVSVVITALALAAIAFLTLEYTTQRSARIDFEQDLSSGRIIRVGYVAAVEGESSIRSVNGKTRPLQIDDPIAIGETLLTSEGARLLVRLHDESELRLGSSSEMIIESFLYDPAVASRNLCSLKMVKGVFRVLTKGITEMNPERFQVKTRMATIGIRGCQVGFQLSAAAESVFILAVTDAVNVTAEKNKTVQTSQGTANAVTIRKPGFVVRVFLDGTLKKEVTDRNEEAALISLTSIHEQSDELTDKAQLEVLIFADTVDGDAGDKVTYNARILHTAASAGNATNVILRNFITPYTSFSGLPISVSGMTPTVSTNMVSQVTTHSGSTVTSLVQAVDFSFDTYGLTNSPIQFTYPLHFTDDVFPHQSLTNKVHLLWNRVTEVDADPDKPPQVYTNKYALMATILGPELIIDTISASSVGDTTTIVYEPTVEDLIIDEEVTYYITAQLTEGTMPIRFTKFLPVVAGIDPLDIVSARFIGSGGGIEHEHSPPLITILDSDGDNIRDKVIYDFGLTVNRGDNQSSQDDRMHLAVTARVTDSDVNRPQKTWIGRVEMRYGETLTLEAEVPVEIITLDLIQDELVPAGFEDERDPEDEPGTTPEEPGTPGEPIEEQPNDGGFSVIITPPQDGGSGIIVTPIPPPEPPPVTEPERPPPGRPPVVPELPELPEPPDLPDIPDPGTTPAGP